MEKIPCKCGCGKYRDKYDERGRIRVYINGHYCSGKNSPMYGVTSPMKGKYHTDETKLKMSKSLKGKNHPMWGKKHTTKSIKNMSDNHADVSGKNNPNYGKFGKDNSRWGKKLSEEAKQNMVNSWTDERREKASKGMVERIKNHKGKYKNTDIELLMQEALTKNEIKFETQKQVKLNKRYHPIDIFIEPNIAIECDGCYHHGCKIHNNTKSLSGIIPQASLKRDPEQTKIMEEMGYIVLRFWGHEIHEDLDCCLKKIEDVINE